MSPEDIARYMNRPWGELAALKRRHVARRRRALGPAASLGIARALHARFRELGAAPDAAERRARDLAHHVALKRMIDRASAAGT